MTDYPILMHGALLIDKPKGITSFDVIRKLRNRFPGVTMGHLGTLDPLATGLLPVFLGKATRLIRYFNESDKTYEAVIELGKSSDTFDTDGKIMNHSIQTAPSQTVIETALQSFLGPQLQIQPAFSAIKKHGKRSYDLARAGESPSLGKRQVTIHEISHIHVQYPWLSFRVQCSSGTYIRSLAHELGEKLNTGGILTELQRTQVGPFRLEYAVVLEQANGTHLIAVQDLILTFVPGHTMLMREKNYFMKKITGKPLVNSTSETTLQESTLCA